MDTVPPTKQRHMAAEDESLEDSVSMVKMAASQKKKIPK